MSYSAGMDIATVIATTTNQPIDSIVWQMPECQHQILHNVYRSQRQWRARIIQHWVEALAAATAIMSIRIEMENERKAHQRTKSMTQPIACRLLMSSQKCHRKSTKTVLLMSPLKSHRSGHIHNTQVCYQFYVRYFFFSLSLNSLSTFTTIFSILCSTLSIAFCNFLILDKITLRSGKDIELKGICISNLMKGKWNSL